MRGDEAEAFSNPVQARGPVFKDSPAGEELPRPVV
jgi:hypothetical protein